jgi:hypothetical protein
MEHTNQIRTSPAKRPAGAVTEGLSMIYRILFLLIIAVACVSCASTEFESWEGRNSVVEGRGGTRKIVDGMDIWTYGDPPRRFQVRGIIQDNRPGGRISMAQMKHDIVAKARQSGGDAIILASSQSQVTGYYTSSSATAYGYGNFASAYGSSTTVPHTHHTATFVVIKYL